MGIRAENLLFEVLSTPVEFRNFGTEGATYGHDRKAPDGESLVGVVVKLRGCDAEGTQRVCLIGDMNEGAGVCDCCNDRDEIVLAWARVYSPEGT